MENDPLDWKHDTAMHVAAGGFGLSVEGCPGCEAARNPLTNAEAEATRLTTELARKTGEVLALEKRVNAQRALARMPLLTNACGGCYGIGKHKKHCKKSPDYDRFLELADKAETLGDNIGANNMGAANHCYMAAGLLREMVKARACGTPGE